MTEIPGGDRLDSRKEIAAYLRRNERTVSRWEKRGLPIYRVQGAQRQAVFAYKHELDAWLKQGKDTDEKKAPEEKDEAPALTTEQPPAVEAPIPLARGFWRKYFVIAALAIGTILAVIFGLTVRPRTSPAPRMARIGFTASAIQAFDDAGHLMWTYGFSGTIDPDYLNNAKRLTALVRLVDLGSDRAVLVTLPLLVGPNPSDGFRTEVDCFSSQGRRLWSYVPQEKFRFGNYELEGPWIVWDVFVSPAPHPLVWVALGHYRWGNSFVVQLDSATGGHTLRLVNTGIIYKLNELHVAGRSYLLAGGFNNEYAAGSLAVMDERRPFAVSPQTEGTRHWCQNCPQGALDYYFLFPRSEINRLRNFWEDSVHFINIDGGEIEVGKAELASPELGREEQLKSVEVFYDFHIQPEIRPFSFRFDSGYDLLHRELEEENKLRHALASCPERLHPEPVRMWTPSSGWTQISLNPVRPVD